MTPEQLIKADQITRFALMKERKEERENRFLKVLGWFMNASPEEVNKYKGRFHAKYMTSVKECLQTGDWSHVWLTKSQKQTVWSVIDQKLQLLVQEGGE